MADNDKSFPKIAVSNWWKLRNLFKQKVPVVVTTTYLSSALSMTEPSAQSNIINPFKKLGILDEAGKPTDLAYDWRDDSKYPAVCQTLLDNTYPQEIRDLYSTAESDQTAITSWFMNYCRCGEPAAKMFTAFYRLLLKADPSPSEESVSQKPKAAVQRQSKKKEQKLPAADVQPKGAEQDKKDADLPSDKPSRSDGSLPQLHIKIQLHISPETTAEQIDKIFESMSKHLKNFTV